MEEFTQLFGNLLAFVYHCFDRIVIHGYLSGLSRPEQVVYFVRQVLGLPEYARVIFRSYAAGGPYYTQQTRSGCGGLTLRIIRAAAYSGGKHPSIGICRRMIANRHRISYFCNRNKPDTTFGASAPHLGGQPCV
jgi:hypothetical protein